MSKPYVTSGVVQCFPQNYLGRDFIVGDLHGAFDLLDHALEVVDFDVTMDRLFCVGNLINTGPDSVRALDFLQLPYTFSVMGDQEDQFCNLTIDAILTMAEFGHSGLDWAAQVETDVIEALQNEMRGLPLAMEVETEKGLVGIAHAEVPIGLTWPEFVDGLNASDKRCVDSALGGSDRIERDCRDTIDGIHRVFCGHNLSAGRPKTLGNLHLIDTGAIFGQLFNQGNLTIVDLSSTYNDMVMVGPGLEARPNLIVVRAPPKSRPDCIEEIAAKRLKSYAMWRERNEVS